MCCWFKETTLNPHILDDGGEEFVVARNVESIAFGENTDLLAKLKSITGLMTGAGIRYLNIPSSNIGEKCFPEYETF